MAKSTLSGAPKPSRTLKAIGECDAELIGEIGFVVGTWRGFLRAVLLAGTGIDRFHAVDVLEQEYGVARDVVHGFHQGFVIELREADHVDGHAEVVGQSGNQRSLAGARRAVEQVGAVVGHAKACVALAGGAEIFDVLHTVLFLAGAQDHGVEGAGRVVLYAFPVNVVAHVEKRCLGDSFAVAFNDEAHEPLQENLFAAERNGGEPFGTALRAAFLSSAR
jgi:hypothetical protein